MRAPAASRRGLRQAVALALVVAVGLLGLAGCNSDTRTGDDEGTLARRPSAYHPEQFPDIPWERLVGYRLTVDDRQLAVAVAGGALRRLSVVYISRASEDTPPAPQTELDRLAGGLASAGWKAVPSTPASGAEHREARWTKNDETLEIAASLEGNSTTIALRLIPQ